MRLTRRQWLAVLAWSALPAGAHAALPPDAAGGQGPRYLSARRRRGRYEAVVVDAQGRDLLAVPMPDRGHSFAIDAPRGRAVAFGRQPGFFAVAFDLRGRQAPQALASAEGRHFFGHGAFDAAGARLYATENDYENGRAVLGVYDAAPGAGYARIGEIDVGGVGAHEVILLRDGRTLCVANGGILTHPDYGKLELNPDSMRPSLAYVDAPSGRLIERIELGADLRKLSVRHLAQAGDGSVWFGCQHVGPRHERPPLVGRHRPGADAQLFEGKPGTTRALENYIGSVAVGSDGRTVATSSPVGGRVVFWDAATGKELGQAALFDGCGIAPDGAGRFLFTSGSGAMQRVDPAGVQGTVLPADEELAWDNHLRPVPDAS
ncbi:DUF1513 domain-containing protein [Orrella sp. JC864]|uniref:DUF1513 domain-containing protein n=1 Tax=Orrella sp. JC864 TaxID=3120298 RepID=UPI0030081B30